MKKITKKVKPLKIRKWLNPLSSPHSGYIRFNLYPSTSYVNCELSIADCDRKIYLDLDFSDVSPHCNTKAQSLKKINILIESLEKIRDNFDIMEEEHNRLYKECG